MEIRGLGKDILDRWAREVKGHETGTNLAIREEVASVAGR